MTKINAFDEAVRPETWDGYIGQHRMKSTLEISIDAAIAERRRLDDVLLIAAPGTGKTTLAELIAKKLYSDFVSITCPIKPERFFNIVEELEEGVVFIDEIHSASRQFQELLQPALEEDRVLLTPDGYEIDTSGIVFIAATVTEFAVKILEPLKTRFLIRPDWETYTQDDIIAIIAGMAIRLGFELSSDVCVGLSNACGSTPRLAKRFVKAARDLNTTGREVTAESVLYHVGVDADGLTADHLEYLRTLKSQTGASGAPTGLNNLANLLCMSPAAVQDLERTLVRQGFVFRGGSGRRLTPAGKEKLGGKRKSHAA
jgi:Holliday junction DNA helicase RuvB